MGVVFIVFAGIAVFAWYIYVTKHSKIKNEDHTEIESEIKQGSDNPAPPPGNSLVPQPPPADSRQPPKDALQKSGEHFPDWYITISFGKSTSANYQKALFLAKGAPQYIEAVEDGILIHQAIYSAKPKEFLQFVSLYELIANWKSTFIIINGRLMDRQILKQVIFCYGQKCRSDKKDYCHGGYGISVVPFSCYQIGISRWRNQWWSFYYKQGLFYVLDKQAIKELIDSAYVTRQFCPAFDYDKINGQLGSFPDKLTRSQLQKMYEERSVKYYDSSIF